MTFNTFHFLVSIPMYLCDILDTARSSRRGGQIM